MRRIRVEQATAPQREFWASPAKFTYFRGGVGSGKTVAGVVKALSMPAGSTGMILAPTYPMLRDATLRTFLDVTRKADLLVDFLKGERVAIVRGGRTVFFRTANDPDRLRGPNLGWFWPDEACLMKDAVWPIMLGRLREHPRKAWCTSTPRGKNWTHETFDKGGPEYRLVRASSRSNVFQPDEFVASMEANYSHDFAQQEIEGEVLDDAQETLVPEWWLDAMELTVAPKGAKAGRRRMGVDLGYGTGRDSFTVICRDDLGILYGFESAYVGVPQAASLIADWSRKLKVRPEDITYDANGPGQQMPRYLEAYGLADARKYFGSAEGNRKAHRRRDLVAWRMRERLDPDRPQFWEPVATQGRHFAFEVPSAAAIGAPRQPPFTLPRNRPWWPRLKEEIRGLKYEMKGRKVKLEKKEDYCARLKRSTNLLDALLMTFDVADEGG